VPGEVITFNLDSRHSSHANLIARPPAYTGKPAHIPQMLRDKLAQAVALTLTGRRQVGLFLSGGMDSAAIYYELVKTLKVPPRSFTTRFELPHDRCQHNDDANTAAALVREYKTKHREVLIGEQDWVDALVPSVLAMEEPRQGKSYPAYYACNRLLSQMGCTVTLSGDGGDELLRGYKHQLNPPYERRVEGLRPDRELRNEELRLSLHAQMAYLSDWLPEAGLTGDAGNDFMYVESLTTLAEDFLIRNDKLGAAFSMEARFPMMCNVFRDFCRGIPSDMKVGHGPEGWAFNNKILLRWAYETRLPADITGKKKTGWRAPTDDWLIGIATRPATDGPVRQYVRETLRDPSIRELFEITDDDIENRYLNNRDFAGPAKASGKAAVGPGMAAQKELFSVLMFAAWFKAFNMRLW
jgi:asparagine synthase (glutamine-hydrolysing)